MMHIKHLLFISLLLPSLCFADDLVHNDVTNLSQDIARQETLAEPEADAQWSDKAQEVLIQALSLTGIKYKYGGNSPDTGFDCSGFVRYVFSQATKITLPPTARAISQIGKTVKKEELRPGDLVFFNTLKTAFSHVGIYMGDNKFIHAPRTGANVRVENMNNSYWSSRFNGAQRIETEAD